MKLKKLIAAAAAAAVTVSAMAVNVFAYDVTVGSTGNYEVVIKGENSWCDYTGTDLSEVYGVTYHVTFSDDVLSSWAGGAIGTSSTANSWSTQEWGTDTSKPIDADTENGTITVLYDEPPITDADEYGIFSLQVYNSNPGVTVLSADILGKDGKVLSDEAAAVTEAAAADEAKDEDAAADEAADETAAAETDAPAATEAPAETAAQTTTAAPADGSTDSGRTGNVPAMAMLSVMAIAGAAAAVSRRRK